MKEKRYADDHMNAVLKFAALAFLLSPLAWAQGQSSILLSQACGPENTKFAVHQGGLQPLPSAPPKAKARIVVFTEAISIVAGCWLSARVGLDGKWIGANCVGTYISTDVDPGEHHLCADLQQKKSAKYTALYGLTAEAGKVYYFRAEIIDSNRYGINIAMHLDPINEDEGRLLLAVRRPSESKLK